MSVLKETSDIFLNIWFDKNFWTGLLFGVFTCVSVGATLHMFKSLLEVVNANPTDDSEKRPKKRKNSDEVNSDDVSSDFIEKTYKPYKMVLVVRKDLKMGKGKIAAQCSHAAVGAYKEALKDPDTFYLWEAKGQPKIVLETNSEESLLSLLQQCKERNIIHCLIQDAGRTQVAPGSKTVLAVGPGPVSEVDSITGGLKLLN